MVVGAYIQVPTSISFWMGDPLNITKLVLGGLIPTVAVLQYRVWSVMQRK